MRLHHFHGGIYLPDHKEESTSSPIRKMPLPKLLHLPCRQHLGVKADPCVNVGDHVLKGQLIAKSHGLISANIHASSSGQVIAIENRAVAHLSGMTDVCISIETDGEDRWGETYQPIIYWQDQSPADLVKRIRNCGIVGLGGATFPTDVKLNPQNKSINTLIINAAECEPYISCDDMLMREYPTEIIRGIAVIRHILNAENCILAIEDNKPEAIEAMQKASDSATQVVKIPTLYPSGGERQLIQLLLNREVPSGGYPHDIGVVVQNVGTIYAIAEAVFNGTPLVSRIVTVTGKGVEQPGNFHALLGTPVEDLIAAAGGKTQDYSCLIYGGPMMGIDLKSEKIPLGKNGNCILLPSANELPHPQQETPCIRCSRCVDVCPARLLPHELYWFAKGRNFDKAAEYHLLDCIECACCSHVCPSSIPLVDYYRFAKSQLRIKAEEKRKAEHARIRHEKRIARLERIKAERKANLRKKKEAIGKTGKSKAAKNAAIKAAMKRVAAKKQASQQEANE